MKPSSQLGLSLVEALAAMVVFAALALVAAPPVVEALRNSRVRAAGRLVSGQVRLARSQAVGTGWQYRVVGVGAGSTASRANQFRVMARSSPTTTWPAATGGPQESASLFVGEWIDLDSLHPGVRLNPTDSGEFAVTFDPRGSPIELTLNFDPLEIVDADGNQHWLQVSAAGNVRVD